MTMRHHSIRRWIGAGILLAALATLGAAASEKLPIGSQAPKADRAMPGVDGETYSLRSAAEANGVVVLFTGNTCPWVKAWEDRYRALAAHADSHDVGVLAVNANAGARDDGEGLAGMKQRARKGSYPFPYVLDKTARLADAFGATTTPGVYLFNGTLRLVYRGAIDDDAKNAEAVEQSYLRTAIEAMAGGEKLPTKITTAVGCEIQRGEGTRR